MAKTKSSPTRNLLFFGLIIFALVFYIKKKGFDSSFFSSDEPIEEIEVEIEEEIEIETEIEFETEIEVDERNNDIPRLGLVGNSEKLNTYTDAINRHSRRVFDSYYRYLSWCDADTGPTGKERNIYGLYSLYDYKNLANKFESAKSINPSIPQLDVVGDEFLLALDNVQELVSQMYDYYDQKDYKDDQFARGKAAHKGLIDAFKSFAKAELALRNSLNPLIQGELLAQIEAANQKEDRLFSLMTDVMLTSIKIRNQGNVKELSNLDVTSYQEELEAYSQSINTLEEYTNSHSDHSSSRIGSLVKKHKSVLKTGKELMRRVRDNKGYKDSEKMIYTPTSGWMVKGSPARLIYDHNSLLSAYNNLRLETDHPKLIQGSLFHVNGPFL